MWLNWIAEKLGKTDKSAGGGTTLEEPGLSSIQLREQILSLIKTRPEFRGEGAECSGDEQFWRMLQESVHKTMISWVDLLFSQIENYASAHNANVSNPELQVKSEAPRLYSDTPACDAIRQAGQPVLSYKGMYGIKAWRLMILGYDGKIGVYLLTEAKAAAANNNMEGHAPLTVLCAKADVDTITWVQDGNPVQPADLKFIARDLFAELLKTIRRDAIAESRTGCMKEPPPVELLKPNEFEEPGMVPKKTRPKYAFTSALETESSEIMESPPLSHHLDCSVCDVPGARGTDVSGAWYALLRALDRELAREDRAAAMPDAGDERIKIHTARIRHLKTFRQKLLLLLLEWQTVHSGDPL